MAISGKIKAKQLNGVAPWGSGYRGSVEIDVEELEISDSVKAEEIVPEYDAEDLLDAIGETDVISWLEYKGYSIEVA